VKEDGEREGGEKREEVKFENPGRPYTNRKGQLEVSGEVFSEAVTTHLLFLLFCLNHYNVSIN
jgi:hypothetical protein